VLTEMNKNKHNITVFWSRAGGGKEYCGTCDPRSHGCPSYNM